MILIVLITLIYIFSSIAEYLVHRFIMHNELIYFYKTHSLHHLATNKNMTLNKKIDNYKLLGHEESLCLSGWESGLVFGFVIFIIYPICIKIVGEKFYSFNSLMALLFTILLCIYAKITWDTIHPILHGESPKKCGKLLIIQNPKFINNRFYKWLMNNHKAHHTHKGKAKGNYNITLPGADFIFGTYNIIHS